MNHKYVVLGEVNRVGAFSLLDDRTTIVDALASAGDMSVFAKRDSVTIIRDMNGKRVIDVVNMVNRDVFTSPYFYLRNGDIIYVEPLPEKRLPLLEDERIRRLQIFTTVLTSLVLVINVVMQVAR
jgi:polysaccharide biosynthesis/export protein